MTSMTTSASPSLVLAQQRISELRREAEHARLARAVRTRSRTRAAWPAGLMTALLNSLGAEGPSARRTRRTDLCATC